MWSEILKVIPQVDGSALAQMEKSISGKFSNVAKKFGKGLVAALTGGGIVGAGISLIDKILNPLKETQDAINRTIRQADDIGTYAEQFNTTSGKLLKLTALAKSTGLEPEALYMLMEKFQSAVAQAEADPTAPTSVRNFVGIKDSADAFFEFIQSLQKMDTNKQLLVQQDVFGEKQILKMADFLRTDFAYQTKKMNLRGSEEYTGRNNNLNALNDRKDRTMAAQWAEDMYKKGNATPGQFGIKQFMIDAMTDQNQRELNRENERIGRYSSSDQLNRAADKINDTLERIVGELGKLLTKLTPFVDAVVKMVPGRGWRGIFGGEDK